MDPQRLFQLRKTAVMPDQESIASSAGGRELVRQRNGGQQQRFPDHAAYIRYLRGVNYVRTRNVAPPAPPTPSVTAPGAPTAVSATAGDAQATITFTPPTSNGGAAITGYTVTSSPDGITATGPASPITVTGLTNGTPYTFTVVATNSAGASVASTPSNPITPSGLPGAPTTVNVIAENGQAVISFGPPITDGGSPIISYTVTSTPGNITEVGTSSPITILGLTNGTSYSFSIIATNSMGDSTPVNTSSVTPSNPSTSAPTITSIYPTTTSLIVYFTPPTSFGTITNYEYSINGGATFTPLSPVDAASPITILSLTPTTLYNIAIRAINNVPSTGDSSNIVPISTKTSVVDLAFTTPGTTSWTAPAGVKGVQYLVVGGGGGGGGTYSKINVLGNVPVQATPPVGGGYWIYNGTTNATYTYARMYNGTNTNTSGGASTFTEPIRLTASADTAIPPGGNDSTRWHGNKEVIYYLKTVGPPRVSNWGYGSYIVGSSNNLPSGGSGGGACGQIKATFAATQFYNVTPGTTYAVIVGDGGEGGTAATDVENAGGKGGDSTFDVFTSEGGSGGQPSRVLTNNTDGYYNGGRGGQDGSVTLREGQGGQGAGGAGQQSNVTVGGYGGTASGVGVNFPGGYAPGGQGGAPNVVASGTTTPNIGAGGKGTGATLNSYAAGIKGGSGVVRLKYYV
jgi:trimeric autotransporter adhesin